MTCPEKIESTFYEINEKTGERTPIATNEYVRIDLYADVLTNLVNSQTLLKFIMVKVGIFDMQSLKNELNKIIGSNEKILEKYFKKDGI